MISIRQPAPTRRAVPVAAVARAVLVELAYSASPCSRRDAKRAVNNARVAVARLNTSSAPAFRFPRRAGA